MNKLLDEVVEKLNGIWPIKEEGSNIRFILYRPGLKGTAFYPFYLHHRSKGESTIGTKEEFIQRAKELGFINGYKWGKEYPTKGEKPNLSDDVIFEFRSNFSALWSYPVTMTKVSDARWCDEIIHFRIVDERFKPAEQGPKIGSKVILGCYEKDGQISTKISYEVEVLAKHNGKYIVYEARNNVYYPVNPKEIQDNKDLLDRASKADEEKQKIIQSIINALHHSHASTNKEKAEIAYEVMKGML